MEYIEIDGVYCEVVHVSECGTWAIVVNHETGAEFQIEL